MTSEEEQARYLPLNRKEVFYTATVLPQIICADGLAHLGRFLSLAGAGNVAVDIDPERQRVELYTEYNLKIAITGDPASRYGKHAPKQNYTPDLVLLIGGDPPLLIVVEGKMFEAPSVGNLIKQIEAQRQHIVEPLKRILAPSLHAVQVALLPATYAEKFHSTSVDFSIVTWEQVVDAYRDVRAARYFLRRLELALTGYPNLVSKNTQGGQNKDDNITGVEIRDGHLQGTLPYRTMGRQGGFNGSALRKDLEDGGWRTRKYEVSKSIKPAGKNWFPVADFVRELSEVGTYTL